MEEIKRIKTNWEELWPLKNILNEVCNGITISDFDKKIGNLNEVNKLLKKISSFKLNPLIEFELNSHELKILINSFDEVFIAIEEWEYEIRIGISKKEAIDLIKKILE